jgi:hypothetical protein
MKISPNFTEEDWLHLYDDSHVCHANFDSGEAQGAFLAYRQGDGRHGKFREQSNAAELLASTGTLSRIGENACRPTRLER